MSSSDHFKVKEIPGYDPPYQEKPRAHVTNARPYSYKDIILTRWLWVISSFSLVSINLLAALICISDMYNTGYNSTSHYFMSSTFTFTLGALAVIHSWLIKKE